MPDDNETALVRRCAHRIYPIIAPDHPLTWATWIHPDNRANIKRLFERDRGRFWVDYLENGNLYVSDSISRVNGYMLVGELLVRLGCGSMISCTPQWLEDKGFRFAGTFKNYEEDHDTWLNS